MSAIKVTGRVESHGTNNTVILLLDDAVGWDPPDRLTTVVLPRSPRVVRAPMDGPNLPPVGAHVELTLEWKP